MSFVIERDMEVPEWKEQTMLPGFSGGRLPRRSIAGKGREEEEEDKESRKLQMRKEIAPQVIAIVDTQPTSQRTVEQRVKQNWDCSQIEDRDEDGVMNWDEDDELKNQWEEVKKVEEKLIRKEVGGGSRRPCKRYRSLCLLSVCPQEKR